MNIQPYKVLIVEDDNNVAAALKNELQSQGYTVDCAVSVHEGLARAKHEDFDVVLTDLWLPDPGDLKSPGGLKTVCQLRAVKPHLPVIVMSGSATGDGEIESIKLGAYGYIRKPCKLQELLDVLGKAVTARRVVSKAAEPGESVTAEDTLVQRRDKDCNRSTVPAPVRGEPGSANKKVARALTASRVMKAGGRMEPVRQLLLRIVQRFHNRLVRSSSIIEGQKELGRYRMLMSGLRHDATNFLAHIVAGTRDLATFARKTIRRNSWSTFRSRGKKSPLDL